MGINCEFVKTKRKEHEGNGNWESVRNQNSLQNFRKDSYFLLLPRSPPSLSRAIPLPPTYS